MARLVEVIRGAGGENKTCSGERKSPQLVEIPLVIESRLTLSLALPEASLPSSGAGAGDMASPDLEVFLSRFRSLSKAEVKSSLVVSREACSFSGCFSCLLILSA